MTSMIRINFKEYYANNMSFMTICKQTLPCRKSKITFILLNV